MFELPKLESERIVYQVEESRAGTAYVAFCPELLVTAFGDTGEEARAALQKEIGEYLEQCDELGVMEETLAEAGFYDNGEVWMSSLVSPQEC